MADICNRCGEKIENDWDKQSFEKPNGKMVTLHLSCEIEKGIKPLCLKEVE